MDTSKLKKLNTLTKKPMLLYGIGCLVLFALSLFTVYFLRVVYYPKWLGQIKGTLVLFVAFLGIFTAFFVSHIFKNKNLPLFMACLLFISGFVFALSTPPNQVPDEQTHFLRGYAMAQGQFGFDANHQYPNDVNLLIKHFPVAHNNGYPAKEDNTVYNRFVEYNQALTNGDIAPNTQIIIFQVVPYIPQAIGIFIAKLLGFGALGAYYFGRISNLLFFCICAYFALKLCGKFKIIMFTVMAMPLVVFTVASHSNDTFLFGLMFLMFASVLDKTFDNKHFALFACSMALLCITKLSYIVFFILLFAVPKEKWNIQFKDKKINKIACVILSILAFLLANKLMALYISLTSNYGEIPRTMTDSNPMEQFKFILRNPFRYLVVFLDTLRNNSFYLFGGGLFGWLDVDIRLISVFTPIIMMINTIKQSYNFNKHHKNITVLFFITSILTYGVVLTGMYISWTPVTMPQIIGVQMRYMIPAFLGFLFVIAYYFSGFITSKVKNTDYSCIVTSFIFCLFSTALMLITYYLPLRAVVFVG